MVVLAMASLNSFAQKCFVAPPPASPSPLLTPAMLTASLKDDHLSPPPAQLPTSPPRHGIAMSAAGKAATFAVNAMELRYGRGASSGTRRRAFLRTRAIADDLNVPPVNSGDPTDQEPDLPSFPDLEAEDFPSKNVGGFAGDTPYTLDLSAMAAVGGGSGGNEVQVMTATQISYQPRLVWFARSEEEENQYLDRAINATIAGAAGAFTITKILTVDHDYWHGWTVFEILRYAPVHNWSAYEEALQNNPILAKMMISGVVYSLGDWIAQCYEGKPILDFNRTRMFRSGLVGFCLHGSLSHFYYHLCEALFPFKEWWVVPLKVAFDQTLWSGVWNSIYFVVLGLLRFESPANILSELKATFWPLLTAGWKLWPFAHLVTYGVIPVEQRLLWVDCVELVWVTILSMYSNEKAEARILEAANEAALELRVTSSESEGKSSEVQ